MGSVMNTENTQKYGVPRLRRSWIWLPRKKLNVEDLGL